MAEVVDDVEIGWKGSMLDGQLYAELGLYSMDYTNMQMEGFKGGASLSEVASITNIGDSQIQGIEGSIRYFAGGFGLTGSFGYTDSELGAIEIVDDCGLPFDCGGATNPCPGDVNKGCVGAFPACYDYSPFFLTISGSENLFSPKLSYTFSVDYAFNLSSGGTLTPRLGFHHADSAYTNSLQTASDNYYRTDERNVVNFSLTYERDEWEVQLYGNNVSDELYIEGHSNDGGAVLYGDPETWGVRARYSF